MESEYEKRRNRLKQIIEELHLDALLVSSLVNVRYLCGFTGTNGFLLISDIAEVLYTDSRYIEQGMEESLNEIDVFLSHGFKGITGLSGFNKINQLGFESENISHSEFISVSEILNERTKLVPTRGVIEKIRSIKDENEIDLIKSAASLADMAITYALNLLESGISESEIAWSIEKFLKENGADDIAFDTIVATGVNSSKPHHRGGTAVVKPGDPLVIDMGASIKGYNSDITRTIIVEGRDNQFDSVYDTVLEAQMAAINAVEEGISGKELDLIARKVIENRGYGENFSHGLGHGIGLEVHEMPMVVPSSEILLEDGMIFTIEPGVYIPGWGGVRIEDMILLESGRTSILTNSPK